MDTWSRPEQSWTKPPQTGRTSRKSHSDRGPNDARSQGGRGVRSRATEVKESCCFQYGNSFGGRFRLTAMKSPHQKDEKERSARASSRTTADATQMIAICPSSF